MRETRENEKMMVRADARSIGLVTSHDTRVSTRWQGSGTKSGECVSIFPDGSRVPFVKPSTKTTNVAGIKRRAQVNNRAKRDILLQATMRSIHEGDN